MKIEKSITINKSSGLVFDYLKITRNQDNFSVWNMADPNMKKPIKVLMEQLVLYTAGIVLLKMWVQGNRKMSLFSPIFKKMLGKDLEKGLLNLKSILETQ
jgi:hypothetical protein